MQAKNGLFHFSHGIPGKSLQKMDLLRLFVTGQSLFAGILYGFKGGRIPRILEDHIRHDLLPEIPVRHPDNRAFQDSGIGVDNLFDLKRGNV